MGLLEHAASALQRPWLALGVSVPVLTTLMLLWVDEFNVRGLMGARGAASRWTPEAGPTPTSSTTRRPQSATAPPQLHGRCVAPGAAGPPLAWGPRGPGRPQVGASITVHPPKYYAAAKFLEQYASCPAAVDALSLFLVFTDAKDLQLFREAQACLSPDVPEDAWTAVVSVAPSTGWRTPSGGTNQIIAAYKKWQGLAYMMDLGEEAPEYGFLVDAELLLYDNGGEDTRGPDCQLTRGPWSHFLSRIRASEASRTFPAARVGTMTSYTFSGGFTRSGQDYDRALIQENLHFVARGSITHCNTAPCKEIKRQVKDVLFSWWTDLPWTNLQVVGRMFATLAGHGPTQGWCNLTSELSFVRFEHIGYHQWCVLNEGFTFRDVTNITGEAKWGSYMEDPQPGARLAELRPLWVSGEALERIENGVIPPLSSEEPPLLIFHADKGRPRAKREQTKALWEGVLLQILLLHGRTDYNKENIS